VDKKDLKLFRELLQQKKKDLTKGIEHVADEALKKSQKDAAGDLSAYSLHMADMATDNYDREFSLSLADGEQKTLYRINEALERIDSKTFGNCEVCGKKISKVRLKAVPYAELCVPCQEKQEKRK
jgi:RNA polymerase-binding protein DksA